MALRASQDDYFTEEELDEEDSQSQVSLSNIFSFTNFCFRFSLGAFYNGEKTQKVTAKKAVSFR